jgi:hypothetical protein
VKPAPLHRVDMRAHTVAARYSLDARSVVIPAVSVGHARVTAIRESHGAAGLPCWRGLVRESLPHTTARLLESQPPRPRRASPRRRRSSSRVEVFA